jgi:hypothetical protein
MEKTIIQSVLEGEDAPHLYVENISCPLQEFLFPGHSQLA